MQTRHTTFPFPVLALLALSIIAVIVPFAHVLGDLYNLWNLEPEYSHGFIIPVLSAFLIWRQRAEIRGMPLTGSWLGVLLIAAGLGLRYIGELSTMHTLEHYAFLLVVYGLVLAVTGPAIFRHLWMPLLILIFAVPLPTFFTKELSLELQLLSSMFGVWLMRLAGISVLLQGNVIDLGSYQLEVAEACSGLRYLFPLMTLAFIMVFLFRAPVWKRVLLFLSSIPITVVMNSLRIAFIGITVDRWGSGMAEGVLHDFEGWVVFMFSTGTLILTAFALNRIGTPGATWRDTFAVLGGEPAAAPPTQRPAPSGLRAIPASFMAAAVLVLLGAVADAALPKPQTFTPARASFDEFPTHIGAWSGHRGAMESRYLDMLRLDDYVLGDYQESAAGRPVNLYVAYYRTQDASRAIHSPHDCIPGGGWQIQRLERRMLTGADGRVFPVNRAVIQLGATREIAYYWFQERGRRLTNEYSVRWYLFWDGLTRHRTDGALVRFVSELPVGASESDVDARILRLALPVEQQLNRYVPE